MFHMQLAQLAYRSRDTYSYFIHPLHKMSVVNKACLKYEISIRKNGFRVYIINQVFSKMKQTIKRKFNLDQMTFNFNNGKSLITLI